MMDAHRILVIAPHPDDEVLGCGGTLALCADRGAQIHVLVVFDGAAGDPLRKHDRVNYVAMRQEEAVAGGQTLGLDRYTFWDLPEGHVATKGEVQAGSERLARLVAELDPDLILAPWPGDEHVDHRSVAQVVSHFLERGEYEGDVYGFEVWSELVADQRVDVSPVWPRKVQAIEQHRTQLEYADLVQQASRMAQRFGPGVHEGFQRWGRCG